MYKVMIIEDDNKLREEMKDILLKYKYNVVTVEEFKTVEEQFDREKPDALLLDINLPCYDGFYLCRIFRRKSNIPIIIVSARNDETNQIMGIELGADDYIVKPFTSSILIAKLGGVIRRCYGTLSASTKSLSLNGLYLNDTTFTVSYNGKAEELSKNELTLLRYLMENKDTYVAREKLLECLWDDMAFVDDNTLTVNVTRVKSKLSLLGLDNIIITKRGFGYMLTFSKH